MKCIIVDDEPLAREAIENQVANIPELTLVGTFSSALSAQRLLEQTQVDLAFLDIQMPGLTGIEFAHSIPAQTLIIFTTAYSEYAIDSYEVDAVDFIVKPIETERFKKAVNKAISYHKLLTQDEKQNVESGTGNFIFIKSERRFCKVRFDDILFVEGLKDYVVLQLTNQKIITRMNLKNITPLLPANIFLRISKSYIVNTSHIDAFDNNDVYIGQHEIAIGESFRDEFFNEYLLKNNLFGQMPKKE